MKMRRIVLLRITSNFQRNFMLMKCKLSLLLLKMEKIIPFLMFISKNSKKCTTYENIVHKHTYILETPKMQITFFKFVWRCAISSSSLFIPRGRRRQQCGYDQATLQMSLHTEDRVPKKSA